MRYVSIENAEVGMCLAYDLYDTQGRTVIGCGCELTDVYIKRLKEFGFAGVYIDDELSKDIEMKPVIPPQLRQAGIECVKNCDIDQCAKVASAIVAEILPQGKVSLEMSDLRSFDDYTYAHSVNVAVLCCVIGMGLEMSEKDLDYLVMAALLHDLGKLQIPQAILNKPGRLTQEEYSIMKEHARRSYELLEGRYDISAHVKNAVLFHHENVDGSGYPNGLLGNEQSLFVRVLHVADVYDALTSKRPYKDGYSPSEAAEYLMGACGIMFDKTVVEKFLEYIPIYPRGTLITLSDNRKGIVIENSGKNNLRPIIRLIDSENEIDLLDRNNMSLTVVSEEMVTDTVLEDKEKMRNHMIQPIRKKKILAVDDMVTNLHMLRDILEKKYDVVLVKSGQQAINYITKKEYPDLILMDIDMPEMDGVETTRAINAITDNQVPVVFVTAITDINTVLTCKELNAAGYIARPYKSVYIKSEIERVLEGVEANR